MTLSKLVLMAGAMSLAAHPVLAQAVQVNPEAVAEPVAASDQIEIGDDTIVIASQRIEEPAPQPVFLPEADVPAVDLPPLYQPQDQLERGLWMRMDEYERDLKSSQLVIDDEALNAYVRGVLCKTVGEADCRNVRLYLMRTPHFNATMAPNGVMQIWSGLLLRTQNEAQLATVLAHEYAHFEERHSVRLFRQAKEKSNAATWLAFTGIGLIFAIGLQGSIFKFSRDMEKEADIGGMAMLAEAGYDTREAAVIWEQLLDEQDATRVGRGKKAKRRKNRAGMFDSHPASPERVTYLRAQSELEPGVAGSTGQASYQAAMRKWWPVFVDDQLKMNDYGASGFLLDSMVKANGNTSWLQYARAEMHRRRGGDGDYEKALTYYSEAIEQGGELPEMWRGRGMVLRKLDRKPEGAADLREYLARAPDASDHSMIAMIAGETQ